MKYKEILIKYRQTLQEEHEDLPTRRLDNFDEGYDLSHEPDRDAIISHVLWMIGHILEERMEGEKLERWFGFVQAIMFTTGEHNLNQLKEHSRSAIKLWDEQNNLEDPDLL